MARLHPLILTVIGAALVALLGWLCVVMSFGAALARWSYDLPFPVRSNLATPEICLVTLDEKAARDLRQPLDATWDRRLHAQLVRSLTAAGARAILFDIVFDQPGPDPAADEEFAAAMKENGRVFLGGALSVNPARGFVEEQVIAPAVPFRRAAAGWGLLAFRPLDPDFGVRRIFPGTEEIASAPWRVAGALGAALPDLEKAVAEPPRWINFYGPPGHVPAVNYAQALRPAELPPGFFRDRIVLVGGRLSIGNLAQEKDEFLTPYSHWRRPFAAGVEIHATILLNLLRGDWLHRLAAPAESRLIILFGLAVTALLSVVCAFCPFRATAVAAGVIVAVAAAACWSVWQQRVWFDWLVPAAIQTPVALFWAISTNYVRETRRRLAIRRAFALYLSPHMADEIAESRFDLKPGGEIVEATMMFTDLEGFTKLSEKLRDPRKISEVLIAYFNNTTRDILDNRGTIIKYVGDAVYATWGAPLPDDDHASHAVLAAWAMHQGSQRDVHGHRLVTRIGVNTGPALAGNLGSDFRFDYTLIGDAVNLASRLEGMNKMLGTRVLLSASTWEKVSAQFRARFVGDFKVVGREQPVGVYELLGPRENGTPPDPATTLDEALAAFRAGDLAIARRLMLEARDAREGGDGVASFYLAEIARLETAGPLPTGWQGVIRLMDK